MIGMSRRALVAGLALALSAATAAHAQRSANPSELPKVAPVFARHGMVVAQENRAARIGVEVLRRGGNAVDAAVAVGFAMAVTYPRAGNIGGGGFMLIHLAKRNEQFAIDYRETAPAATTPEMYLDARGEPDPKKLRELGSAVGVPGTVAGLALAHRKYGSGKFTLGQLIAPSIMLARDGIPVEDDVADSLPYMQPMFARWPASAKIFLRRDGKVLAPGDRLVQADLARTLCAIARNGPRAFYEGADRGEDRRRGSRGRWRDDGGRSEELSRRSSARRCAALIEAMTWFRCRRLRRAACILLQMLNVLEEYKLRANDPASLHLMIEAMKLAYADRAQHLGDPDTVKVPVAASQLEELCQGAARRHRSRQGQAAHGTSSPAIRHRSDGDNTTHYSVVDRFGNAVSNTYTLNLSYGNRPGRRQAPACCSTTSSTISPPSPTRRTHSAWSVSTQPTRRDRTSGRSRR